MMSSANHSAIGNTFALTLTTPASTSDVVNHTTTVDPYVIHGVSVAEVAVESLVLILIMTVAFTANAALWIVVLTTRGLRTESNILILCLSLADLLVAIVGAPITVLTIIKSRWIFSSQVCTFVGYMNMLTFVASVQSLGVISINRYFKICRPSKYLDIYTYRNATLMFAGVWIYSSTLSIPPFLGWASYDFLPLASICFCKWPESPSYAVFMILMCFCVPCFAMICCYVAIIRAFLRSRRTVQAFATRSFKKTDNSSEFQYQETPNNVESKSCPVKRLKNALKSDHAHEESQNSVNLPITPVFRHLQKSEDKSATKNHLFIVAENKVTRSHGDDVSHASFTESSSQVRQRNSCRGATDFRLSPVIGSIEDESNLFSIQSVPSCFNDLSDVTKYDLKESNCFCQTQNQRSTPKDFQLSNSNTLTIRINTCNSPMNKGSNQDLSNSDDVLHRVSGEDLQDLEVSTEDLKSNQMDSARHDVFQRQDRIDNRSNHLQSHKHYLSEDSSMNSEDGSKFQRPKSMTNNPGTQQNVCELETNDNDSVDGDERNNWSQSTGDVLQDDVPTGTTDISFQYSTEKNGKLSLKVNKDVVSHGSSSHLSVAIDIQGITHENHVHYNGTNDNQLSKSRKETPGNRIAFSKRSRWLSVPLLKSNDSLASDPSRTPSSTTTSLGSTDLSSDSIHKHQSALFLNSSHLPSSPTKLSTSNVNSMRPFKSEEEVDNMLKMERTNSGNKQDPDSSSKSDKKSRLSVSSPCVLTTMSGRKTPKTMQIIAHQRRTREEFQLAGSLLVVIFMFILCWFPYCISMFVSIATPEHSSHSLDITALLLGYMNSCFNPIVYGLMNRRFKEGYRNLYRKFLRCSKSRVAPVRIITNSNSSLV